MDAAIHAMKQFGFDDEVVIAKMRELLKEYGGQYGFTEIYSVLLEALLSNQDKEKCEEIQEAAHRETSNMNEIVDREMMEEDHPVVPTAGFIDIPVCSSTPLAAIPPPSPQQLVASLSPSTPVVGAALPLPPPPQSLPASPPVVDAALPLPPPPPQSLPASPPVVDAALPLPPPPPQSLPASPPVVDAALPLPPPSQSLSASPPVVEAALPPVMDAALQLPPPALLVGKILPPETQPSQQGQAKPYDVRKVCPRPRPRFDLRLEEGSSSRYEAQKRRDWNSFGRFLKNQISPVSISQCNVGHVIEFLRYLDQFGKTKVHLQGCVYFGQLYPLDSPCSCPLRQAWGSLDSITGRLRAAYEENVGASEKNPFGDRAIRVYLRQVKECQVKARGVSYEKRKKKIKANDEAK